MQELILYMKSSNLLPRKVAKQVGYFNCKKDVIECFLQSYLHSAVQIMVIRIQFTLK